MAYTSPGQHQVTKHPDNGVISPHYCVDMRASPVLYQRTGNLILATPQCIFRGRTMYVTEKQYAQNLDRRLMSMVGRFPRRVSVAAVARIGPSRDHLPVASSFNDIFLPVADFTSMEVKLD